MTQISDFPNELLLQIYPHLLLKGLIAAQGVCQKWRQLVPLSDIPAHRRAFYEFYMKLIQSPVFFRTRPWVLANLRPFDRQEFLNALLEQYPHLPEEFSLWILEWPACAVIGCCWPGLPNVKLRFGILIDPNSDEELADHVERLEGTNYLGCMPPQVSAVDQSFSMSPDWVAAILLWRVRNTDIWLIVDEREGLSGKVIDTGDASEINDEYAVEYGSLMEWQRHIWAKIVLYFEKPYYLPRPHLPPKKSLEGWDGRIPWNCRNEQHAAEQYGSDGLDGLDETDESYESDEPDEQDEGELDEHDSKRLEYSSYHSMDPTVFYTN